jgi:Raf kinase inhibitor-like YbhB/YbcL family protein
MEDHMDNFPANEYIEGVTDFGKAGYGGPAPPDKRHTYVFKVYALDSGLLDLDDKVTTKADVEKAMEGHIIEQATLTGTYAP